MILDPGIGFGKTLAHNLALLAGVEELAALGRPVLIGVSRKSMFDALLGRPVDERMPGSVAAGLAAVARGAAVLRVHDVRETVDALRVWTAVAEAGVVGVPDAVRGELVCACVVRRAGSTVGNAELIAWCKARLTPYKAPVRITFPDALPKGASGKILRRELRAMLREASAER